MTGVLTPYERRLTRLQEQIGRTERFAVWIDVNEGLADLAEDAGTAFAVIAEKYGMDLAPHLHESYVRFNSLWSYWRLEEDDAFLVGEFRIGNLMDALATPPPPFSVSRSTPEELELHTELRVIDDRPESGTGSQAAVRLQPGVSDPEVWYFHLGMGTLRMDVNYREYLDALILTKGTAGWQFLFCDPAQVRGTHDFAMAADRITTMLKVFPELFPEEDYSDLRARFEERR